MATLLQDYGIVIVEDQRPHSRAKWIVLYDPLIIAPIPTDLPNPQYDSCGSLSTRKHYSYALATANDLGIPNSWNYVYREEPPEIQRLCKWKVLCIPK